MVYSLAIYKNQEGGIINFNKRQGKRNMEQWEVYADRWETELDQVEMTYFVNSQKLIMSVKKRELRNSPPTTKSISWINNESKGEILIET